VGRAHDGVSKPEVLRQQAHEEQDRSTDFSADDRLSSALLVQHEEQQRLAGVAFSPHRHDPALADRLA